MKTLDILVIRPRLFSLFIISLLVVSNITCQIPQAFKYQALLRDIGGNPLQNTSVSVQIKLLQDSIGGSAVYSETHQEITNAFGLVNIAIGYGTPVSGLFSNIDWSSGPYFIEIDADVTGGTNYVKIGSAQLLSVPYALYSQNSASNQWVGDSHRISYNGKVGIGEVNPVGRLDIKQDSTSTDSILFEVKDKAGLPVFAVLETGVRVYVKAGTKGAKGGFSVGGRPTSKGGNEDLFWVTSDSIRMYINAPAKKGAKGGFAVGGRPQGKGEIENFTLLTPDNYLIGQGAGKSLTTGTQNAFLGYRAGQNTNFGSQNVFLGHYAGFSNDTGSNNIFIGDSSGFYNNYGNFNVFLGTTAGKSNTTGFQNIVLGISAGYLLQGGNRNIMIGSNAGYATTEGINNVFIGNFTGATNTTGSFNVFLGRNAGLYSTTGNRNVFLGHQAGYLNSDGSQNIYIGDRSGFNSDSSYANVYIGQLSGFSGIKATANVFMGNFAGYLNIGDFNTFIGHHSGENNTYGNYNTFLGEYSGNANSIGGFNVFIGKEAGEYNSDGSNNVYLGSRAGINSNGNRNIFIGPDAGQDESGSNKLYISNSSVDATQALIYGEFDNKILKINGTLNVNGSGTYTGSWTSTSDQRLKKNIVEFPSVLEKAMNLRPVSYNWKDEELDRSQGRQIGLIAQEVEEVFPQLVVTDQKGLKSIDYSKLSVILLQAFKEQQLIIEQQQQSIQSLKDENKSIKSQIERINTLELEIEKIKSSPEKPAFK